MRLFPHSSPDFHTFTNTSSVNGDGTVGAGGVSQEWMWHSRGPNKALDPTQEVSIPEADTAAACNLLPCEVS